MLPAPCKLWEAIVTKVNRRLFMGTLAAAGVAVAAPQAGHSAPADIDAFMKVSQTLTKRSTLDRTLGQRYLEVFQKKAPDALQDLGALDAAVVAGSLSPLQQISAMKIMRAWYTGQVEKQTVAYEAALMYAVMGTATAYIPTYCATAPGGWSKKPDLS